MHSFMHTMYHSVGAISSTLSSYLNDRDGMFYCPSQLIIICGSLQCDPCLNALLVLSVHEQITNRSSFLDSLCSFLCSFCWSTPSSWLDKYVQSIGNEDFASVLVFVFILFVKHV
eukprot:130670_1